MSEIILIVIFSIYFLVLMYGVFTLMSYRVFSEYKEYIDNDNTGEIIKIEIHVD